MTKKHFKELADILRYSRWAYVSDIAYEEIVKRMATFCADQNPRFSRTKFFLACGCDENGKWVRDV